MKSYRIVWEDEANAREVELFVDYTMSEGIATVEAIRATKVTLYSAATKTVIRTLPVWTETGRRVLSSAYLAAREEAQTLAEEIAAQHLDREEETAAAL